MSKAETAFSSELLLDLGRTARHCRLFRNVTGEFWSGKPLGFEGRVLRLDHAHKVVTGLHDGSADLIGWTRVVITTEMVGSTIAQFTSGEVKVKGHGRIATDQQTWHDAVIAAGGRAGFLWSVEDARRLVALT